MKRVLVTFAERPMKDYPLAVVVVDEDGSRGQEVLVRSVRDGRLVGNGIIHGALIALRGNRDEHLKWPANVEIDERLKEGLEA
jgi:hypothetical protein